jgi:hypothetical protein
VHRQTKLLQIVFALRAASRFASLLDSGQQQSDQYSAMLGRENAGRKFAVVKIIAEQPGFTWVAMFQGDPTGRIIADRSKTHFGKELSIGTGLYSPDSGHAGNADYCRRFVHQLRISSDR